MVRKRSEVRPPRIDPRVRLIRGAWTVRTLAVIDGKIDGTLVGDITKIVPERGTTAAQRRAFAEECKAAGSRHVWFAPARGGEKALGDQKLSAPPENAETVREAIGWLLEHAISSDPEKLVHVVEDALTRAGL
jgi:hypothetical protein